MTAGNATSSNTPAAAHAVKPAQKQRTFYAVNGVILLLVGVSIAANQHAEFGTGLFIVTLSLLCTSPLIFATSYRGKHSLMLVFLAYYFGAFAAKDLVTLLSNRPLPDLKAAAVFSGGEIAIILGVICFILGYLSVARLAGEKQPGMLSREWSPRIMIALGALLWITGFYITAQWQFGIGDRYSGVTLSHSLGGFISLLRMLQPLGSLVLIYCFLTSRSKFALLIMAATMLGDLALGFLGDSKEIALRAPLLYLFSTVILRERLPLTQGIVFILAAGVAFSLFSAYRESVHSKEVSRSEAYRNIGSELDSIARQDKPVGERLAGGLDYFADRITLKQNVELIVARTGNGVKFQGGHTIKPLLYAFIPRLIMPDKADSSMAGQLFNRQFHISADPDTYISVSQLGELYWNFGWPGLIIGMMLIGAVMGAIASALRLDTLMTLPRFLLLLVTVYLLCLQFETSIAQSYTLWARAALMLLVLNALIPKQSTEQNRQ